MKFAMGAQVLSTLTATTSESNDDLGALVRQLAEAGGPLEGRFNGSPVRRAGFMGLRRNVAIAMGNSRLARFAPWLKAWTGATDQGVLAAARWALARLERGAGPDDAS